MTASPVIDLDIVAGIFHRDRNPLVIKGQRHARVLLGIREVNWRLLDRLLGLLRAVGLDTPLGQLVEGYDQVPFMAWWVWAAQLRKTQTLPR